MWMFIGSVALAGSAVARFADGEVVVQVLDGAASCDTALGDEPRKLTLRPSDDGRGWNLTAVDVRTTDGAYGSWSAEGDHRVTGLEASPSGEVSLAFAAVTVERDDGKKESFAGPLKAKWCGAPMGDVLAWAEEGDVVVRIFPKGAVQACEDRGASATQVVGLRRFIGAGGVGWGIQSVYEEETGGTDDFFTEGAEKRPVEGVRAPVGGRLALTFAPVPPGPEGGRTTTLTGPLNAVWCEAGPPPAIGADRPGSSGAWMGVSGRWFEVKGARSSKADGLELSDRELTCDRSVNYMEEDLSMSLTLKGDTLTFWSVSGKLVSPPRSWNIGVGSTPATPRIAADAVELAVVGKVVGLPAEIRGRVPLVTCD